MGGNFISVILLRNRLSLLWIFSTEIVTVKVRMGIVLSETTHFTRKGTDWRSLDPVEI